MDEQKKPAGAEGLKKNLPPQVEKMLASAKEMEAILTNKLNKIDAVSLEKSEMAKQEALKIKADVEEIKRLSLIQTKEGEDALKAKIMEVNQRIETTTRRAAELQKQTVALHKELHDELSAKAPEVKKIIKSIQGLPSTESNKFITEVDAMVREAKERWKEEQANLDKIAEMEKKMKNAKPDTSMPREEIMAKLTQQINLILAPEKPAEAANATGQDETSTSAGPPGGTKSDPPKSNKK